MVSVTSIEASGMRMISEWNFSMRSSRVLRAEAAGKKKAETTTRSRSDRGVGRRTRIMRCATPASCRGRAEADFGGFALGGCGNFKEFAWLESQHVREDVGGELLNFCVQVADYSVVIAPCVLDGVLDLGKGRLERRKTLNSAELRVGFRKRKQAFQRARKHVLGLRLVARAGSGHSAIARVDYRFQGALLVSCVALDGFHQVGNQVVATLELDIDVRPGVVAGDLEAHQAVV